jgi:hypothetical protein
MSLPLGISSITDPVDTGSLSPQPGQVMKVRLVVNVHHPGVQHFHHTVVSVIELQAVGCILVCEFGFQ